VITCSTAIASSGTLATVTRRLDALVLIGAVLALPWTSLAEESPAGIELDELERRAAQTYPEVQVAGAKVARLEAELSEVYWRPFSDVRIQGFLAPTPERRGDALHSAQADVSWDEEMGVLLRTELDLSLPLYTFGRLAAQRNVARDRIEAGRAEVELTRSQVRAKVQQAFYSLQLAEHSRSLLEEGQGYLGHAQDFIEHSLEEDDGVVTESDRLRVEVLAAEIEGRLSDARRAAALSRAALKVLAGLDDDDQVATAPLEPTSMELEPLESYRERAAAARPEIDAARAEVRAGQAQVRAERARYFPDLNLVGSLDYAYSNVIDDQQSSFVNDPGNYLRYNIGVALRWDLDFMTDRARVHQAEARLQGARADEDQTTREVAHRVEQAYIDVASYQELVSARQRGRRASRAWLVSVMQGIDLGVLEPPELVDALRAYFEQSFLYYESVARHETALCALRIASGENGEGPSPSGEPDSSDREDDE
jgi:outer membrane protein TolC